MKSPLPLLAALALVSLSACDQPKPRPGAGASATPISAQAKPASQGLAKRSEVAGFYLDSINEAIDPMNKPAKVVAGPVTLRGFGFDPVAKAPGAAVDIVIDGKAYPTVYGLERPDVAEYFKAPALLETGFTVTLPAGVVKRGRRQAIVRVVSVDKAGYFDSVVIGFDAR